MDIVGGSNSTPIRRMDFIKGKHKTNSPEGPHQPIYQNTTRQKCKDWLTQQLRLV